MDRRGLGIPPAALLYVLVMVVLIGEVPGHPIASEFDNRMAARPIHPHETWDAYHRGGS